MGERRGTFAISRAPEPEGYFRPALTQSVRSAASSDCSRLRTWPPWQPYAAMMQRDRKREGLRVCRAAWLIGVSVREYREIVAGDRMPSLDVYRRVSELYGWPQAWR